MEKSKTFNNEKLKKIVFQYSIAIILLVLCCVMSVLSSAFYSPKNLINIVKQVAVTGLIAYGTTFIIITGGIDLSSGAVVALVGVLAASMNVSGVPLPIVIAAGMLIGAVCGLVSGVIISYTNVPAFIATLGVQQMARAAALLYSNGRPISGFTDSFIAIGNYRVFNVIPLPALIFIGAGLICVILLKNTKQGKHVYAIGGNEAAALSCGINVKFMKTMIYTFAGLLTGLAGIVLTARVTTGNPSVGEGYELDAITAVVIGGASLSGGTGTIFGTVIGALIIGVLNNGLGLLGVSTYWQTFIKGALIITAIILDELKNKSQNKQAE